MVLAPSLYICIVFLACETMRQQNAAQRVNTDTDLAHDRIYCNSYTQRTAGNDTVYTVDLGRAFTFKSISLDMVVLENLFLNMYRSRNGNYNDLSISVNGAVIPLIVDQYLDSVAVLTTWLSDRLAEVLQGYRFNYVL